MPFRIYQFDGLQEVRHFLNGGLVGGKIPLEGVRKLVGKAITFTSPAGTCTFTQGSGTDPDTLQFLDIKSQMETQVTGLKVLMFGSNIAFIKSAEDAVTSLGATSQEARALFGLPVAGAIAGKLVGPSTDAGTPRLDHIAGGQSSQYLLYVWE